jgi:hypothetical protein
VSATSMMITSCKINGPSMLKSKTWSVWQILGSHVASAQALSFEKKCRKDIKGHLETITNEIWEIQLQ